MRLLKINNLGIQFGGLRAVDGLNMGIEQGSIHGLIGPNGAGKTTTFNLISGFIRPTEGSIHLRGDDITGLPMYLVARRGVIRTFQHSTLFAEMTVIENVLVGTHMRYRPKLLASIAGIGNNVKRQVQESAEKALDFFDLMPFANTRAGDLAHGHQRALGIAIALVAEPDIMLLDEPFTGMNPEETRTMMKLMFKIRDSGITILIVEHDMHAIMGLCDIITVMNFGKLLTEGKPAEVRSHKDVIEAYLGSVADASTA